MDRAVEAGRSAAEVWWALDGADRARILRRLADKIRDLRDSFALLDTLDAGRPIRDTGSGDVERAAKLFEYFAGVTDRLRGAAIPVQPGYRNYTQREPFGVVAAITPWNYPLTNAAGKIAPALAAGNSVVLKPAEASPLSALLLARAAHDVGLPPGVLNVINGPGDVTGQALVRHPHVGKVLFTGSTAVGRELAGACGRNLVPVTLELGGKGANIIFADADLGAAAQAAVFSATMNQGQTCTAGSRILVEQSALEALIELMSMLLNRVVIGDPLNPQTQVGPLISAGQLKRVRGYIDAGIAEGAKPVIEIALPPEIDKKGYFIAPIVFCDVDPLGCLAQQEIFGPVVTVIPFVDEDEAVALANCTPYGLSAALWTLDVTRVHRLADRLDAGLIWINTVHTLHPGSPYGGFKQSGLGLEMGEEAVQQLTRLKSIWIGVNKWQSPWK